MALLDIFVGAPQSKYAGVSILLALGVVALAILFGKEQVPIGQKFMFIVLMFVVALPSILLTLFQLTCLVTGSGFRNQKWWCGAYAWIGSIFILIYSVIIVVVGVMSLVNGTSITKDLEQVGTFEHMQVGANKLAREYFQGEETKEEEKKESFQSEEEEKKELFGVPVQKDDLAEQAKRMEQVAAASAEGFQVQKPAPAPASTEAFGNFAAV
jgi:magnesium-transporting ATPase (P-type)